MLKFEGPLQKLFFLFPIGLYGFLAIYTFIGTFHYEFARDTPFSFYDRVDESSIYLACFIFIVAASLYFMGWVLFSLPCRARQVSDRLLEVSIGARRVLILVNLLSILIYIVGYGPLNFFDRSGYTIFNQDRVEWLLKFHFVLFPISIIGLGMVKLQSIRYLLFSIHFLLYFSASTRILGLLFVLYGISRLIKRDGRLNSKVVLCFLLGVYFFIWVLSIRYYPSHGLLENIQNIFYDNNTYQYFWQGLNYITSFSVYGLAYSLEYGDPQFEAFLISLSPLPLSYHGGVESLSSQRLLGTSPMSMVSIVYNAGVVYFSVFFVFLGGLGFWMSKSISHSRVFSLLVAALFVSAILFGIQYNLRGFSRIIYLCIFLILVFKITRALKIKT